MMQGISCNKGVLGSLGACGLRFKDSPHKHGRRFAELRAKGLRALDFRSV